MIKDKKEEEEIGLLEKAFLAGSLNAGAFIGIRNRDGVGSLLVRIRRKNRKVLGRFRYWYGGSLAPEDPGRKFYEYSVSGKKAEVLLRSMRKYLVDHVELLDKLLGKG